MSRRLRCMAAGVLSALVALASIGLDGQTGAKNGEWRFYGGDAGSTKYSPLDQINRDNVKDLRIAWRWRTENFGARPDFNLESTPLMVDGVLFATAGARRNVVAINGATGETLWMWRYDEGARAQRSPRFNSGRGVGYWTDGKDARILYITPGYHLIALDAKSGRPAAGFGVDGIVDLWEDFDQPTPKEGQIGSSSPPMIVGDVAIVGAAMQAGGAPNKENIAGHVRGYDVRTGKRVWIFHTVPKPGEFGHDTWLDHSASYTGNTAVWAPMSADLELGYVYLPVETPTGDFYGGHRPGNNLFADSIVCLDARTGKRVWHFQFIHHDIWDYDTPTAPTLVDITVDGRPIKAVAQITKQAWVYVFDRVTGKPVWPIEERPVPKGDVPGEWYSPTQPFPAKPAPFDRQGVTVDDLIDFTPELKAEAIEDCVGLQNQSDLYAADRGRRQRPQGADDAALRGELAGRGGRSRDRHAVRRLDHGWVPDKPASGSQALQHELHLEQRSDGRASTGRMPGRWPSGTAALQTAVGTNHRDRPEYRGACLGGAQRRHAGMREESSSAERCHPSADGRPRTRRTDRDEDAAAGRRGRRRAQPVRAAFGRTDLPGVPQEDGRGHRSDQAALESDRDSHDLHGEQQAVHRRAVRRHRTARRVPGAQPAVAVVRLATGVVAFAVPGFSAQTPTASQLGPGTFPSAAAAGADVASPSTLAGVFTEDHAARGEDVRRHRQSAISCFVLRGSIYNPAPIRFVADAGQKESSWPVDFVLARWPPSYSSPRLLWRTRRVPSPGLSGMRLVRYCQES